MLDAGTTTPGSAASSRIARTRDRLQAAADAVIERTRRPWMPPALALAALTVLVLVVFVRQVFEGWTFSWDFVGAYSASPAFVGASMGHGHLLAWSPYVASGFPVDIDVQSGVYYPVWWLLGLLRVPLTLGVVTDVQVLHVLFGALGVLALARVRRLAWRWAMAAALAYLFFGGFYGEAEHADIFRGFAYLPWLLWALTPPPEGQPWRRLAAVPAVAWLTVSAAYPAQLVSFALTGLVYLAVALAVEAPGWRRRHLGALGLTALASAAVCAAVLLPYLHAQGSGELVRVLQPTAPVRAGESFSLTDALGLYLNNFAWSYDGSATAWAVGIPVLVGFACARVADLRRHAPLLATGVLALALATTPKIGVVGRAMASLPTLFPSRFPAADYKAVVAIAVIVVAAQSWSSIAARLSRPRVRASLIVAALIAGVYLAPSTDGAPTRWVPVAVAVALACLLLVVARPHRLVLAGALILLIGLDGAREIISYRQLTLGSSWAATPADAAPYRARDSYVRRLPTLLEHPPASRPARLAPFAPLDALHPTGSDPDAAGWTGDGYHLIDYGGTIERALWRADHDPGWTALLLAPWHAYTFACGQANCLGGTVGLPAPSRWRPSPDVRTTSYGPNGIVYEVHAKRFELMVENELAIPGWHTGSRRVRLLSTQLPLRVWKLSPGNYRFTATYQQPGKETQLLVAVVAALAWIGLVALVGLRRHGAVRRADTSGTPRG
jgi:hypothetical protein